MRFRFLLAALLAAALSAGQADAQVVYEFATTAGVTSSSFSVVVGQDLGVRVYLREQTAGAPLFNSNGGLGSGAVRVNFNNPAGVVAVQSAASVRLATTANGGPWDFGNPTINSTSAGLSVAAFASGVFPDADGRVLLGTFTFRGLAEGTTTLTATDLNPTADFDTTSFDATEIPLGSGLLPEHQLRPTHHVGPGYVYRHSGSRAGYVVARRSRAAGGRSRPTAGPATGDHRLNRPSGTEGGFAP